MAHGVQLIGRHTVLANVVDEPQIWKRIPYLRDNGGRAPPIILAVGDRRRVYAAAKHLKDPVLVPEMASKLDPEQSGIMGRAAMVIGYYDGTPVLVAESQMGAPAVQIIVNELLNDHITSTTYNTPSGPLKMPQKGVIRVGTAGGINHKPQPTLHVGDLVIATHTLGLTGATAQALGGPDFFHPQLLETFRRNWLKLGKEFSITDDGYPRANCSPAVVKALGEAATRLNANFQLCGNLTTDSLYARALIPEQRRLCVTQNCRSAEMELTAIAHVARINHAMFGMVAAVVNMSGERQSWFSPGDRSAAEDAAVRTALQAASSLAGVHHAKATRS
jgi:uridine phosphorylase